MSEYVVLARKYRPQTLEDLVGQGAISQTLTNAIELGRVPHALLFTGTRGVGKTTSARILAKALNCQQGPTAHPCGQCSNCLEITAGQSVDVFEIDGASNTSVDDIRELKENVQYAPSKSRFKIYIIDEVHMLSTSAFNALLKTLEEPPAGVYFIFATTEVHKIPETILSRCQRFDFRQITEEQIAGHLRHVMEKENVSVSDLALSMVARQGNGSMRDALSLLDQVIAFSGENIRDEDVIASLGLTDRHLLNDTLEAFVGHNATDAVTALSHVFEKGFDPKTYLLELWENIRLMILLSSCKDLSWLNLQEDHQKQLKAWADRVDAMELDRWFEMIKQALSNLSRVEFPRFVLEVLFLRITRQAPRMELDQLISRLESLEKTFPEGAPRPTPVFKPNHPKLSTTATSAPKSTSAPKAPPATHSKSLPTLFNYIMEQKPPYRGVIAGVKESRWEDDGIHLEFSRSFLFEKAKEPSFCQYVEQAASAQLGGQPVKLHVTMLENQPNQDAKTSSPKRSVTKPTEDAPVIQTAISLFDVSGNDIQVIEEDQ
jgi:DNA polymerase-3 subunit gamma/tau